MDAKKIVRDKAWAVFMSGKGNHRRSHEVFALKPGSVMLAWVEAVTGFADGFDKDAPRTALYISFADGSSFRRMVNQKTWRKI